METYDRKGRRGPARLTGFVLGKFMPVHAGHQLLIDAACARVGEENLTVLVGSRTDEAMPGSLRFEWVKELYPRANVRHLHEDLPQYPHEHPRFWDLWVTAIRRFVPHGPDVVFTSEDYGGELARRLGAQHVRVDSDRKTVPVSATMIRANPMAHWRFIPSCVRPYFVKRVAIYGTESTGKTTLARDLARRYGTVWVPEYARGYLDGKAGDRDPLAEFAPSDVPLIACGQIASEEALARQAYRVLICDTDLLTTRIYSELFFGACPDWIAREAQARRYDLYLFAQPDVPWIAERQRAPRHREKRVERLFRDRLLEKGVPFVEIRGDWARRFEAACEAIDRVIGGE